ncbi:BppU family phage baseplate upper protein [Staphylococcus gallinarum]|uniref:BppU family phage baseplate upper protein n=1 Tax=Staphylococcus gallinarum TaxID=1293 RepID=UPI001E4E3A5E|nr:BppU family phage baseplate upper protein [Staphylococcus gallinarum]MCD8825438.1 phage baseplate upper protein [Staphylococcus gallinarum]
MSMDKIANLQLETTAQYQSLSKLNVQFWNQDRETAILQFKITRNDYPLALSEENVKVFIALESGDSFLVDEKLDFVDQLNGVVSYTIPDDFMKLATEVKGQVYVTTLDEEEVVVQRQFTFNVANDLIADLPAEDKIREFKYFSDMRAEVAEMMTKLNNDFENMNDYVTQVQDTTQEGITALTKLINDKEKAYNDNHVAKMQELDDKGTAYSQQLDEGKQYMDEKFEAFKSSVNGSGLVTTGQSKDWQKYKLTGNDGKRTYLDNLSKNIETYPPGYYECVVPAGSNNFNMPIMSNQASYFAEVNITEGNNSRKQIQVIVSYDNDIYQKTIHSGGADRGWKKIGISNSENPLETTQGSQAKANTAENNAKQYTDEKYNKRNKILFEGTASGVGTAINLDEDLDNFIMLYIIGDFPGGEFSALGNPIGTRNININTDNIVGLEATDAISYECTLKKINRQKLEINSDNYVNILTGEGSGANANKFTIQKIIGVYK